MEQSLFIELIHQTQSTLDSIKKYIQLSLGKFSDKEFGEFFYRKITKEIEKNDLLVKSFLNYVKVTTPIRKKRTVNTLIEEVLKKHQVRLEENRTKIFRTLEKDLPEAIMPDEQLRFVLESVVQYAIAMMPSDESLELSSKSVVLDKGIREDQAFSNRDGNSIEVLIAFTYPMELKERVAPQKEVVPDLILRLVDDIVKRNKGMIKFKFDETKGKMSISLKSPVERRRVIRNS